MQVMNKAQSGDFRAANLLGRKLLASPAVLAQLNTALSTLGTVSASAAAVTSDLRFLSTRAWNPTAQTAQVARSVQVDVTDRPGRPVDLDIRHQPCRDPPGHSGDRGGLTGS